MWLLTLACAAEPKPVNNTTRTALAPQGITLGVSPTTVQSLLSDGSAQLSFHRGYEMTIGPALIASAPEPTYTHEAELAASVRLRYRTERAEGGMGGPEDHLDGTLTAYGQRYAVQCLAQDEWGSPDARWCLEVLATIQPR